MYVQNEDAEEVKPIRPRWSDCQCPECTVLLMTQNEASSRLFVRCEDSVSGGERCTDFHGTESRVSNTENLKPMFASDSNPRHGTSTRGNLVSLINFSKALRLFEIDHLEKVSISSL